MWTMFDRVDLIDADVRIRLAMQACRALTLARLQVVRGKRLQHQNGTLANRAKEERAG